MKRLFVLSFVSVSLLSSVPVMARDYGDRDCKVYVSTAQNEITGRSGNYLTATVMVKKTLLEGDFLSRTSKVRIQGFEDVAPSSIDDRGSEMAYQFTRYAPGIENHTQSAIVTAYIDNGMDRLFDNNDNVDLVAQFNWRYTNPRCGAYR
jgi:hypothetical protein